MEEIRLRDYVAVIVKKIKIIFIIVIIFVTGNLIYRSVFFKDSFQSTAEVLLLEFDLRDKEVYLARYRTYALSQQIKDRLKLDSVAPFPTLSVATNYQLTISVISPQPEKAERICNAWLDSIYTIEKENYEKKKSYLEESLRIMERDIAKMENERKYAIENIGDKLKKPLTCRTPEEERNFSVLNTYMGWLKNADGYMYMLASKLDQTKKELLNYRAPEIITRASKAETVSLSPVTGAILSVFIGLIIGIGIVFVAKEMY